MFLILNTSFKESEMASAKEFYATYNVGDIAKPDWSHLGVSVHPTVKLTWDQIQQSDREENNTKVETHTAAEIQNLIQSFATNVDASQFPPAVVRTGNQEEGSKPFKLKYGFGRVDALSELTDGWFFTVLEGTEDALDDVKAQENEGLPKRLNEEIDMRKFLIGKVTSGAIPKTEQAIRAKFRKVYTYRKKEVENRVVPQVLAELGVELPYELYPSINRVTQWIENNSKEDYVIKGEFDHERDMYGYVMKEGYHWRAVINAILKYNETGKKTYIIFHCGAPTKKANFAVKRKQVLNAFDGFKRAFTACGLKTWPIVILGALPQDKERGENWKVLVDVKSIKNDINHDVIVETLNEEPVAA